jgi:hypothetical protein
LFAQRLKGIGHFFSLGDSEKMKIGSGIMHPSKSRQ